MFAAHVLRESACTMLMTYTTQNCSRSTLDYKWLSVCPLKEINPSGHCLCTVSWCSASWVWLSGAVLWCHIVKRLLVCEVLIVELVFLHPHRK